MNFSVVQRVLGVLLMLFSVTMVPPLLVSVGSSDGAHYSFLTGILFTLGCGLLIWWPVHKQRSELRIRDGFLIVVLFWTVLGLFGAIPFLVANFPVLSVTDAVFESFSGLTTTGATVIQLLEIQPVSILYYRQQLQWLGGMGIIVLAVAILPMLGVGGMQLYRAETPGPIKDSKLTPRITETAKALWYIYLGLTGSCALAYWLAGMSAFDAICHAFSTVAIGGFSTHDVSIGYFQNPWIEIVCIIFMLLAGINFSLHFVAWRSRSLKPYRTDSECLSYLGFLALGVVVIVGGLLATSTYLHVGDNIRNGTFQVVSFMTTTGFTTSAYSIWPGALPMLLILASFIGGSAGSTAGGLKVVRVLLLYKQGMREIVRLVHPNARLPVKLGRKVISSRVVDAVWGFFSAYVALFSILFICLLSTGLDEVTAFSALAASLNNLGPALGDVAVNYASINAPAKWLLIFSMLLGRLEIFTLLALLTPQFWRR